MQFPATMKTLTWCGGYVLIGAVARSDHMAAAGVLAGLLLTPGALVLDWWRWRKLSGKTAPPRLQLLLPPPR
jgi:hypothetical protein